MIESCTECPQYVVKEIEPELPAFCLYWKEGLMLESPTCHNYKEGRIPKEPVSPLSDLPTATPHNGQAGADSKATSHLPYQSSSNHGNDVSPGRYLVKIISVQAYMHSFQEYAAPRARLKFKVLEGPDAGKFLFDNVSLPHPKESKGMKLRRVRIAVRLGLIPWGTGGTIQINWKLLKGKICWLTITCKIFRGRKILTVDNYELMENDADTQPEHPLPLTGAEKEPVIAEHHETAPPSNPVTFPAVPATTTTDTLESASTCFNCSHFRPAVFPNPTQAFGRCEKRKRGRFGCAKVCKFFMEK